MLRRIAVGVAHAIYARGLTLPEAAAATGLPKRKLRRILSAEDRALTLRDLAHIEAGLGVEVCIVLQPERPYPPRRRAPADEAEPAPSEGAPA